MMLNEKILLNHNNYPITIPKTEFFPGFSIQYTYAHHLLSPHHIAPQNGYYGKIETAQGWLYLGQTVQDVLRQYKTLKYQEKQEIIQN